MDEMKGVLLIDEDSDDLWNFARYFEKAGYIYTGVNSSKALDLLTIKRTLDERYNRIFIAQNFEGAPQGYDICKKLRKKNHYKGYITGFIPNSQDLNSVKEWKNSGASSVIEKNDLLDLLKSSGNELNLSDHLEDRIDLL